jgi:hypothetical protein
MKKWFMLMICVLTPCLCVAADQAAQSPAKTVTVSDDDFWNEDWGPDNFPRISDNKINQLLVQIRKENPARADELEKLRKDDIEKFHSQMRAEVNKLLRSQPPREGGPGGPQGPGQPPVPDGKAPSVDRPGQQVQRGEPGSPDRWRSRMERMHDDFIAWLEINYPNQAAGLKQVREKEPDKYMERVMEKMHVYDPIRQAERSNPRLALVMKEDLELQKMRDDILRQLKENSKNREKLLAELKEVVSQRFDTILERKKLQYEELKKKLEDLQKQVRAQEKELEKLKNNKDTAVQDHFNELVNKAEKMNWD